MKEYIDLGLPSGTRWASENEKGLFTFDEAKEKFGDSVPTIDEWRELIDNCEWLWDFRNKQMVVIGKNGKRITLPAAGLRNGTGLFSAGSNGYYWSSSPYADYPNYAYRVLFSSDRVDLGYHYHFGWRSVRLVKRK